MPRIRIYFIAILFLIPLVFSCTKKDNKDAIARVGDTYLYKADIVPLLDSKMSRSDSISFVTNYINNWASKQLLLSKAKINLPEERLAEFDRLVNDYRTDLYTRAYREALVQQSQDTVVSDAQLRDFYEREKENFKLREKLVKLRFVAFPHQFLKKDVVVSKLKSFKAEDITYLDSIAVQFRKLNFNDSIWIASSRVIEEIPPLTFENEEKYLKKSQFFELQDSIGVYLAKVTDVLNVNDIAPLSYIRPTIKQVLLNRRRLRYGRKLETELIDEAIKENEFEVYGQNK